MKTVPLKSPFCCMPKLFLLVFVMIAAPVTAEVPLRAYNASYDMYEGGMHIAVSELRLEQSASAWRWSMETRARGVYALFVNKVPFSETTFTMQENDLKLKEILISDRNDRDKYESASFDWSKGHLDITRRGQQKQLELDNGVYDYHSIHMLAASMQNQNIDKTTVDFYRKGKLVKARFVFSGLGTVNVNGEKLDVRIYEQMISRSKSKTKYFYDTRNPLLPVRIERLKSGESLKIMALREVSWAL